MNDRRARVLGLDGLDPVVASEGGLKWVSMAEVDVSVELILLGLANGKPHFVPLVDGAGGMARSPAVWRALSMLPAEDAAIYGTARSLIDWHNRHRFCAQCGSPMFFKAERWAGELHIARALFHDALDREPQAHVYYDTHVPWVTLHDALPKKTSET